MSDFVLVHGSGQNAGSWSRVADLLRARGHRVATPDLPKGTPDLRLEDHAAHIADAVQGPRAVVAAHSLSGAFLPLVPALKDCGLLVFVAAVIPEIGRSIREQFTADPTMFHAAWIEAGPRWFDPSQAEGLAREFLFHDCDEATLSWALTTMDNLDTRNLVTQRPPLSTWPEVPGETIVATGDRTLQPDWCRRVGRRTLGREPHDMPSGHCPHVSIPEATAARLESLARRHGLAGAEK